MQRAVGHRRHVGLVHVIALDMFEHFAINRQRAIGFVVIRLAQHESGRGVRDNQHRHDNHDLLHQWAHLATLRINFISISVVAKSKRGARSANGPDFQRSRQPSGRLSDAIPTPI